MRKVYLDHAASTPIFDEVIDEMASSMKAVYANPSSTHQFGRTAKSLIETVRKNIAKQFNAAASEFIFTSGGTESNNLILRNAVVSLGVTRIITSKLEHHAVLHTVEALFQDYSVELQYVKHSDDGVLDLLHLRSLLEENSTKTLVSLMHINNEIGTILDLKSTALLCKEHGALFHTDAVQAVGHFPIDLDQLSIDFMSASAHKFHGPKGVGFAYFKKGFDLQPFLFGGEQEKGVRAGTEAVHAILGMDKALQLSYKTLDTDITYIKGLKSYFISLLKKEFPKIAFNGCSADIEKSTATIVSVRLPVEQPLLLFNLDLKGIAVSGGSACQSGNNRGSHVLNELLAPEASLKTSIRFSFSKMNNTDDILYVIEVLKNLLPKKQTD